MASRSPSKLRRREPIRLFWWRHDFPRGRNFGDEITADLLAGIWGLDCVWAPPNMCEMAGAGSIIEILDRDCGDNKIAVWGSGFMRSGRRNRNPSLSFHAVRGRRSLSRISDREGVKIGDPGLLASLVYERARRVSHPVGIVPHYADYDAPILEEMRDRGMKIIDPLMPPRRVAESITSCELILSSSLHGLIVADSFGVPNAWMPLGNRVHGGAYKFQDYYSSIGRRLIPITPRAALSAQALRRRKVGYKRVNSLPAMQNNIVSAFPLSIAKAHG